jgi:hypothetical protein
VKEVKYRTDINPYRVGYHQYSKEPAKQEAVFKALAEFLTEKGIINRAFKGSGFYTIKLEDDSYFSIASDASICSFGGEAVKLKFRFQLWKVTLKYRKSRYFVTFAER